MKLVLKTERATIHYLPETNSLLLTWLNFPDEATYKSTLSEGLSLIKPYGATSWISDIRNEGVIGTQLSNWFQTEIIPKAIQFGIRRVGTILDTDIFKKVYVNYSKKQAFNQGVEAIEVFDSLESAINWIEEGNSQPNLV